MKFLISRKNLDRKDLRNLEKKYLLKVNKIGPYIVISENGLILNTKNGLTPIVDGYLRNFDFDLQDVASQTENAIEFIAEQWPVSDAITGSFACTLINENKKEIIICNDSIGIYPIYYFVTEEEFFISNSLIWLGAISGAEIDEIGLFQRTYCPEFANIGSRTLLKNTKRLLPGEWIRFNEAGNVLTQQFDNVLYQNISKTTTPLDYWETFKRELAYCVGGQENVNIALSGGMDSRLIIAGQPKDKQLFCHTYGEETFYETQVAKRIAGLYNANFRSYSKPELYFPPKEIIERYTLETESIYLNSWLEILESMKREPGEIMLLGDMTESLQGRNLPLNKNWKSFKKYYLGGEEYLFRENTSDAFNQWKNKIIEDYTKLVSQSHINRLNIKQSENNLRIGIIQDLNEIFERIQQHNLPYLELVIELFSWFTHARIPMGKQIRILNTQFKSYCMPMSTHILRLTSNLHPNQRLSGRYIKALFSSIKELKVAGALPTSQIPYIPFTTPEFFKIPLWFLRSEIDDILIARIMKSGNPKKRYRVLKSFNWVEIYQHPQLESNLNSCFEKNYLGEYSRMVVKGALERRDLKQWPLSNINIINAAALNAELELLDSTKKSNEV